MLLTISADNRSIKYHCFDERSNLCLVKASIDRLETSIPTLSYQRHKGELHQVEIPQIDYGNAFPFILTTLSDKEWGVDQNLNSLRAVVYRVVHGGDRFIETQIVTPLLLRAIEEHSHLAPLQNPFILKAIHAFSDRLSNVPQVAVFDTTFHETIPLHARSYPLPHEICQRYGIRRYGFHGMFHNYVAKRGAKLLNRSPENLKILSCYLDQTCSITAIDGGKSIGCSSGLSILDGSMMSTSPGEIAPAMFFHLLKHKNITTDEMAELFHSDSGLFGVSGIDANIDKLFELALSEGNQRAMLALQMFCYQITQQLGKQIATLGALDLLIFTGEIGEKFPRIRSKICETLKFFGVNLDPKKNRAKSSEFRIDAGNSSVPILVIPTDEGLAIASEATIFLKEQVVKRPDPLAEFRELMERKENDHEDDGNESEEAEKELVVPSAWLSIYGNK